MKTFIDQNKTFENSKQKIRLVLHFEVADFTRAGNLGFIGPAVTGILYRVEINHAINKKTASYRYIP